MTLCNGGGRRGKEKAKKKKKKINRLGFLKNDMVYDTENIG